jgi:hypothetical protein
MWLRPVLSMLFSCSQNFPIIIEFALSPISDPSRSLLKISSFQKQEKMVNLEINGNLNK